MSMPACSPTSTCSYKLGHKRLVSYRAPCPHPTFSLPAPAAVERLLPCMQRSCACSAVRCFTSLMPHFLLFCRAAS